MKIDRTRILMLAVFGITLCAGLAAGLLAARLPAKTVDVTPAAAPESAPLAEQLNLSDEQREQMRNIWEGIRDLCRNGSDGVRQAEREKEIAIESLIPAEKKEAYDKIQRTYAETCAGLVGRRQAAFDKAVRDTHKILSGPQRVKYDQILKKRVGSQAPGDHDPMADPALSPSTAPLLSGS